MYSAREQVPVWIQVLAVTGCLVMVLSWGSESWTCGPTAVESNLARGRAGEQQGGCRLREPRPTPRLKLASGSSHALPPFIRTRLSLLLPQSQPPLSSLPASLSPSLSPSLTGIPRGATIALNISWKVTSDLLLTSPLFTVMVCLLSSETDRSCKFKENGFLLPVKAADDFTGF